MSRDNPKLKRADAKRVALSQKHERAYLSQQIDQCGKLAGQLAMVLIHMHERLAAGYPARRGGRKAGRGK